MTSVTANRSLNKKSLLLLTMIVFIGLGLRLIDWQERSLWQDEVFTASIASGNPLFEATVLPDNVNLDPLSPVPASEYRTHAIKPQSDDNFWQGIQHNVQMPLYPVLMRGWLANIDNNPTSMRLFSIACGVLSIILVFFVGQRWQNTHVGLIAATLMALSGFQLIYSQTARLYEWLQLLILINTWLCLLIQQSEKYKRRYWLLFFAGSLLGLYTHYYYLFIAGFHFCWLLINNRDKAKPTLVCFGLLGLCLIPWLPVFQAQKNFLLTQTGHGNLQGLWEPLKLIERLWNNALSLISPKSTTVKILTTLILVIGIWQAFSKKEIKPFYFMGLWLLFGIGGLIAVDVIGDTHRLMTKRYLMIIAPAIYLWLSWALLQCKLWQPKATIIIGALLFGLMSQNAGEVLSGKKFLKKQNYKTAGDMISWSANPNDLVIISHSGVHATGLSFYLPDELAMMGISRRNPGVFWNNDELHQKLTQLIENRQQVWLVEAHLKPPQLKLFLRQWFKQRFEIVQEKKFSSIRVYQLVKNAESN